jgi:hypothetical protein
VFAIVIKNGSCAFFVLVESNLYLGFMVFEPGMLQTFAGKRSAVLVVLQERLEQVKAVMGDAQYFASEVSHFPVGVVL